MLFHEDVCVCVCVFIFEYEFKALAGFCEEGFDRTK